MGKFYEGVASACELYVRQLAWLNTAPEIEHKGPGKKPEPVTRIKERQAKCEPIVLPDNPAHYLTDWLFEIGPKTATGMGDGPIGWPDMQAWEHLTGIELDPWEARTIRRLSRAFINEQHDARKPGCPAPYSEVPQEARDRVSDQFAAMMGVFGRKHG